MPVAKENVWKKKCIKSFKAPKITLLTPEVLDSWVTTV